MGNWHCISSSCATVHYREYQGAKIRWRYGSEPWREINGDDYTFTDYPQFPQTAPKAYRIWAKGKVLTRVPPPPDTVPPQPIRYSSGQEILCTVNTWFQSPIWSVKPVVNSAGSWLWEVTHTPVVGGNQFQGNCVKQTISFNVGTPRSNGGLEGVEANTNVNAPAVASFYDWYLVEDTQVVLRNCVNQQNFTCTFKVFKNGQIVYQETRNVCPEVQKIPCQLSAVNKQIEIKKLPYLERVEIRDQSINTVFVSPIQAPLLDTKPLPQNCYNVYKTDILAPPLLSNFVPLPGVVNPYEYITQICSAVGCPPPEYQVICDCQCQTCPSDTCPIECGNYICCYNDYGVSVAQIPLVDYCGGNS